MGDIVSGILGGGGGKSLAPSPVTITQPGPAKPSPADLAAVGAMKPELMGATTPAWKAGLAGGTTGPLPKGGGATATPLGGGEIGQQADAMTAVINYLLGGG